MMDEKGYIQFTCDWERIDHVEYDRLGQVIQWRGLLHDERLLGVDANGVGYGNVSERLPGSDAFVITATQTGHLREVDGSHFAVVHDSDVQRNWIRCSGAIRASSESLSHAVLYHADPRIGAVVHVHNAEAWLRLRDSVPTTAPSAEAGTVAMAAEIRRVAEGKMGRPTVIVMGGHRDGLISFGRDVGEAAAIMLEACGRTIPEAYTSLLTFDR